MAPLQAWKNGADASVNPIPACVGGVGGARVVVALEGRPGAVRGLGATRSDKLHTSCLILRGAKKARGYSSEVLVGNGGGGPRSDDATLVRRRVYWILECICFLRVLAVYILEGVGIPRSAAVRGRIGADCGGERE